MTKSPRVLGVKSMLISKTGHKYCHPEHRFTGKLREGSHVSENLRMNEILHFVQNDKNFKKIEILNLLITICENLRN